jgi:hypothetical protein
MNKQQFLEELSDLYGTCLALVEKKNSDYATDDDPFNNFRLSETVAGISVEESIMVRMLDKVARLGQLLEKDAQVSDEKVEDTLMDLINYSGILRVYMKTKNQSFVATNETGFHPR